MSTRRVPGHEKESRSAYDRPPSRSYDTATRARVGSINRPPSHEPRRRELWEPAWFRVQVDRGRDRPGTRRHPHRTPPTMAGAQRYAGRAASVPKPGRVPWIAGGPRHHSPGLRGCRRVLSAASFDSVLVVGARRLGALQGQHPEEKLTIYRGAALPVSRDTALDQIHDRVMTNAPASTAARATCDFGGRAPTTTTADAVAQ